MKSVPAISLSNVCKVYPSGVEAVHSFSLDVEEGEFIVLVGPSGCGKSTTLRMIAGLEDITAGELYVNGTYANALSPKERDVAMVFQSYALYPEMSVFNNLAFGLRMRKVSEPLRDESGKPVLAIDEKRAKRAERKVKLLAKDLSRIAREKEKAEAKPSSEAKDKRLASLEMLESAIAKEKASAEREHERLLVEPVPVFKKRRYSKEEIFEKVTAAAKVLEISEYLNRKPRELSGGQRQRVALGRALVRKPTLFLMDEPLSNLDAKLRVSMRSEIVALQRRVGAAAIYVTHDQTEAMTMADRIVVMKDGYVQQIGTPGEIYAHPANLFVATFIGSPAMNVLDILFDEGGIVLQDGFRLPLPEGFIASKKAFYERKIRETSSALEKENGYLQAVEGDSRKARNEKARLAAKIAGLEEKLALFQKAAASPKGNLRLGIRPEDFEVSPEGTPCPLESVEPLGKEFILHGAFHGHRIVARIMSKANLAAEKEVRLSYEKDAIRLFDPISEEVIK